MQCIGVCYALCVSHDLLLSTAHFLRSRTKTRVQWRYLTLNNAMPIFGFQVLRTFHRLSILSNTWCAHVKPEFPLIIFLNQRTQIPMKNIYDEDKVQFPH